MTKEITKAKIIQEIQDKLSLREFESSPFLFSETVIPIYDIKPHLERWRVALKEKSVSSAAAVGFFVVPNDEKWTLSRYDVIFMAAGAYTVTGAYIYRTEDGERIYLDMLEGRSVSYHIELPTPAILNPGDAIWILIDSYTSTANLRLYIDVLKEEVR